MQSRQKFLDPEEEEVTVCWSLSTLQHIDNRFVRTISEGLDKKLTPTAVPVKRIKVKTKAVRETDLMGEPVIQVDSDTDLKQQMDNILRKEPNLTKPKKSTAKVTRRTWHAAFKMLNVCTCACFTPVRLCFKHNSFEPNYFFWG